MAITRAKSPLVIPTRDAEPGFREQIHGLDLNHDGKITRAEVKSVLAPAYPQRVDLIRQGITEDMVVDHVMKLLGAESPATLEVTVAQALAASDRRLGWETGPSSKPAPQPSSDPVRNARYVLQRLNDEISSLESQNAAKQQQVSSIVQQIAQRKAEIQREQDNKRTIGIIGALFGAPMITAASIITMQNDDARIRQLTSELNQAQADQKRIAGKLEQYQQLKSTVGGKVDQLERSLRTPARPIPPGTPAATAKLLGSAEKLADVRRTLNVLQQERELLLSVRDAAKEIGLDLDQTLAHLNDVLDQANQMLEDSRQETLDLLKALLSDNPNQAGLNYIKDMARGRLKQLLSDALDGPVQAAPNPLRDELKSRLLDSLVDGLIP